MSRLTNFADEARIAVDTVAGRAAGFINPNVRLGVTGLSRAGKTVFISALVHNLLHGGRLPLFEPVSSGRLADAILQPQPDDNVPRFQYEDHIRALVDERTWPESTRQISELRLTVEYESASGWSRLFSRGRLNIDIVDYPGEWLLDLPLLGQDYQEFSKRALSLARLPGRTDLAGNFLELVRSTDPHAPADETKAAKLAEAFTAYLRVCKDDARSLSTLPPGRFLMPGDLEGSPALTFAPLAISGSATGRRGSLQAMMERRFDAYKTHVVKPFFREHIARLDRQIVLVDVLQALNAGPASVTDLQRALTEIMECFRAGRSNLITGLFARRIDRILVAATKADHLHHETHAQLQNVVRGLVDKAIQSANFSGATVEVLAIAAIRATREGSVRRNGEDLPVIVGTPIQGETVGKQTFDGDTETAVFPGDLPNGPLHTTDDGELQGSLEFPNVNFVRFRPPKLERTSDGFALSLPHIRLDKALQFLLGDRLA